jgi:hypothetical protein
MPKAGRPAVPPEDRRKNGDISMSPANWEKLEAIASHRGVRRGRIVEELLEQAQIPHCQAKKEIKMSFDVIEKKLEAAGYGITKQFEQDPFDSRLFKYVIGRKGGDGKWVEKDRFHSLTEIQEWIDTRELMA